jgi:ribonucleoside-diphosphate reductase alpha subunit
MNKKSMFVVKRNGKQEHVYYDKITARNMKLAADLSVDTVALSQAVIRGLIPGITTREIDKLSCESAVYRSIYEPDYGILASRIAWNDLHKNTPDTFLKCITLLKNNFNSIKNKNSPLFDPLIYDFAVKYIDEIENAIDYEKDYLYDYFAFKIIEKSYLQKINGKTVERMQHMLMRVALGIHGPSNRNGIKTVGDIKKVLNCFNGLSNRKYIHATPTLFNAATINPQLSSCFLLTCPDSIGDAEYDEDNNYLLSPPDEESIYDCLKDCSKISKQAGGIGVDVTSVRCRGSYIAGTNGFSNGIVPLIRVFNETGRYVDQGGGKRKGAFSIYLQPWHPDTEEFLGIRIAGGDENFKARDVFPALFCPRLLFDRVKSNSVWSYFCPASYPELRTLWGKEFNDRYIQLESEGKFVRQTTAHHLWEQIIKSLIETGLPYVLNKDEANEKSNQKNIGPITNSNLCCEIMQYNTPKSIAVCNLASLSLPDYVKDDKFDFEDLGKNTEDITENLNSIIDRNFSPVRHCAVNNLSYRPIGIGYQGLADVFAMFLLPWADEKLQKVPNKETADLNLAISETVYYFALRKSAELAQKDGSYDGFEGSPASQGILQFDMWNKKPITSHDRTVEYNYSWKMPSYNWDELKEQVKKGLRNSLLIAPMPTATTSHILGNNECFEPFTSNIYSRKGLAGNFPIVNKHLYRNLLSCGKWTKENVDKIIQNNGSVQSLDISDHLKNVFKTNWELSQKVIIDLSADRGTVVDQSQSLNIHIPAPTKAMLSSSLMYAVEKGLKTISYYTRSLSTVEPVNFAIMDVSDPTEKIKEGIKEEKEGKQKEKKKQQVYCNEDICTTCSS